MGRERLDGQAESGGRTRCGLDLARRDPEARHRAGKRVDRDPQADPAHTVSHGAIELGDRVREHQRPAGAGARQKRVRLGRTVDHDVPLIGLGNRDGELILDLARDLGARAGELGRVQELDHAVGLV